MFFGGSLRVSGWVVLGCCRKSYLRPAETVSFSRLDFSQNNKHDTFWHVASTGYFFVLLLWDIAVSDFRPLEICKMQALHCLLSLLLSTATQITIPINIFICFKYSMKSVFFLEIHVKVWAKVFYIQICFKCETSLWFFLIRTVVYRKKNFMEKIVFLL